MTESDANCSPLENSLICEKIPGISSIRRHFDAFAPRKTRLSAALFPQIP